MTHPNTDAYSGGAVCCPHVETFDRNDELSSRVVELERQVAA